MLLIDTDILIDYSRGIEEIKQLLIDLESDYILAISVITQLELMVGCNNKSEFNSLKKFISKFEIVQLSKPISENTVRLFEKYRLSHGVQIPDMLIASTAISLKIPLLTKNKKDFRFIKKLDLIN